MESHDPDFIAETRAIGVRKRHNPFHQVGAGVYNLGGKDGAAACPYSVHLGVALTTLGSVEHDVFMYRVKRAAMDKMFSKSTISRLEDNMATLAQVF